MAMLYLYIGTEGQLGGGFTLFQFFEILPWLQTIFNENEKLVQMSIVLDHGEAVTDFGCPRWGTFCCLPPPWSYTRAFYEF